MNLRSILVFTFVSMLLAGGMVAAGCTDTPTVTNGEDCEDGEEFDEALDECVPVDQQDAGIPDADDNGDDNGFEPGSNHPHYNRDQLAPYGDESGDGIPNKYDNCPYVHNPDQTDSSGDGIGDACDNCPDIANPEQESHEDNPYWNTGAWRTHPYNEAGEIRVGDKCCADPDLCGDAGESPSPYADLQTDSTGDGVPDIMDNCPNEPNPPTDPDCVAENCPDDPHCTECICQCEFEYPCEGDEVLTEGADSCAQPDTSGDGVGNMCDNCPYDYNPQQEVTDGNPYWDPHPYNPSVTTMRMGDACSPVPNNIETCQTEEIEFERMAPNIYISFDLSGSMRRTVSSTGNSRIDEAINGLDLVAEQLHDEIRFGLGTFPGGSGSCSTSHVMDVGEYTAAQLQSEWSGFSAGGMTPIENSLTDILNNDRLSDPNDAFDNQRIKAVLLVTDGLANCSSGDAVEGVIDKIEELYNRDILTFVVGFDFNDDSLGQYALAGGTGSHILADNANELAQEISDVADLLVSCDYHVDVPDTADPRKTWVHIDGDGLSSSERGYRDPNEYTFDPSSNTVQFTDEACDELRGIDTEEMEVTIEMGCTTQCVPEEPQGLCDLYYETCGEDYPCDSCQPEICDGQDNNCSGVVDDNCPDCGIYEAPCEQDADCCDNFVCVDGQCDHSCYPDGAPCYESDDCCGGTCAIESGADHGTCVTG